MKNRNIKTKIALIVLIMLIPAIVTALSFSSSPSINSGAAQAYTLQNLSCNWTESGDATIATAYWYMNGSLQYTDTPAIAPSILLSGNTSKNQFWECNVTIENATDNLTMSDSINVVNTLPYAPTLYNLTGSDLGDEVDIYEDTLYTMDINSTDADGDTIEYTSDAGSFCSLNMNDVTGTFTCTPTNSDLLSPETPRVKQVIFNAKDGGSGQGNNLIVDFTVIPQNDQAEFDQTPDATENVSAEHVWNATITGTDEESNYPLNFTMKSNLTDSFPGLLQINSTDNTTAVISFTTQDGAPTNDHVGVWNISVNLTDVNGSNATRGPAQYSFILIINLTNHNPTIITDPEVTNSTQGQLYTLYVYGNDTDSNDTLNWSINYLVNSSAYCINNFPWSISTENSSAANSTGMINVTLTNDYIACREVNITLSDSEGGSESTYAKLNITNINDAPVIYQIGADGNISEQTTHRYSSFTYKVNASDPDNLTYDADNTANLTYWINETNPFIQISNSGLITANPTTDAHVKNWSINITVGDGMYNDTETMLLIVLNNTAPELSIENTSYIYNQSDMIEIPFTVVDRDNDSIVFSVTSHTNFSDSIYLVNVTGNNYSGGINNQSNVLNLTSTSSRLANDKVGFHNITINASDDLGSSIENQSTAVINISILNENDAPFFDQNQDNSSDTLTMGLVVKDVNFQKTIHVTDYDLSVPTNYANETVNLTYNDSTVGLNSISISKSDSNTFVLSFTPNSTGVQWIQLILNDSDNVTAVQNVSFTVKDSTSAPVLEEIRPFYNDSLGMTVFSFTNASNYTNYTEDINFSENRTVIFDAIITNDTGVTDNNLTYEWYVDGTLNTTIGNADPGSNTSLSIDYGFWSNGTYNITLIATDERYSSVNFTWYLDVADLNRPPVYYNGTLEDLIVNHTSEYVNYMSYRWNDGTNVQRFYDPDDDLDSDGIRYADEGLENESTSLTYSVAEELSCPIATISFVGDDLRISPKETGLCQVQFVATDPYNESVTSDVVLLTIIGATTTSGSGSGTSSGGSTTRTQVVTVPLEEEVDVPKPIKIISPISVETYANKTITMPITIKNTWEEEIKGIKLNATMSNESNATYSFDQSYFSTIPVGGESTALLSVTNYRSDGPFEITIYAAVAEPEFTDSTTILINSLEQSDIGDDVKSKVTFARDMLSENPECRELNDLLERADRALSSMNYKESLNLVNGVINGCKFLMNQDQLLRQENPSLVEKSFDFLDSHADKLVIGAGVLLLVTIAFYVVAAVKKLITEK